MKKVFVCVLILSTTTGFAQKKANPETYAKTITATDLKRHLYIIAGPEMEGRETGTEGEYKAAAYIENEFKRIGLEPANNGSYRMYYPVYKDSLLHAKLEINGTQYTLDKDFNVNLSNYPSMMAFSEAVFLGPKVTPDSIKNYDLTGKLVIVSGTVAGRSEALRTKGMAAIMTVSDLYPRSRPLSRSGNQTVQFYKRSYTPQQFTLSAQLLDTLLGRRMDSAKAFTTPVVINANILTEIQKRTTISQSSNVVGVLPGTTKKDEYVIITAHFDHNGKRDTVIYYGADDDGSGTVSIIELAEAFAKAKKEKRGPARSILFMTVSGEEKGLWGSGHYAGNPIFPLEKTTVNLNIDMIGRIDPKRTKGDSLNYVYVVGDDKLSTDLRKISESVNNKYTKLELDYKYNDPDDREFIYYRSDHYNFARKGVPIIFYFNGTHADYHRPSDTPDKINYDLLTKRARFVFYTAWEMANRNEMLKRDLPLPALRRQ